MINRPLRMHCLQSSSTIGRWSLVLGLLLAVGPLVQSVTPCRGAAAPDDATSDTTITAVVPGAQWTCAETVAATVVRAVPAERSTFSLDGPSGDALLESVSTESPPLFLDVPRRAPPPPAVSALEALRPVVLQI